VQIRCIGNTSNRSAIGAKVWVQATIDGNPVWQVREITSQDGYKVQNSMIAHFGLGDAAVMDELRVEWPSGNIQTLNNVNADQFITITETSGTSSILVTSPNGGQAWEGGTLHNITWLSSGSITSVNIECSTDNGGTWNTIAASAANTGSYPWTVPSSASAQCLVRVSDAGGSAADASDAVFTIIVPTITVTAPSGGELWDVGTTPNITWNTTGTVGNVRVEYSTDNGSTYHTIIDSTANDGTYVWTVPDEVSPSCRVRISAVSGGVSGLSDDVFAIVPIVTITAPVNGNEWTAGSTYSITWTCTGTMANVMLEYSLDNGTTYTTIGTTANDGAYEWVVPDVYSPESRVRILDMGDNELDVSETFFIRRTIDPNTFEKITSGAVVNDGGKSFRCSFGDYDNDGYMDLFVGNWDYQNNFLYHNNGDGTFTKITSGSVVTDGGKTLGGSWGDYDDDEDLDLFVCNNSYTNNFL
jgi:hypothetical protein